MPSWLLLVDSLLAATLSSECVACHEPLDAPTRGPACAGCWAAITPVPPHYGAMSGPLGHCAAAGEYEGPLRDIIHVFKYEHRRSLAAPLGRLMRERGAAVLDDAACVVPVPLHPLRRLRRGFNQSTDLATHLTLPVVHALWRARSTVPQAGLDADARRRNVRRAFVPSPLFSRSRRQALIVDRVVVLVDDVRTTGATLAACAEVLKDMGAAEVRAMTAAVVRGGHREVSRHT
jgi:ComF family protein